MLHAGVSNAASERTRGGDDVTDDEDEHGPEPGAGAAEQLRHERAGPGCDGDGVPATQGGGRHQADGGDAGLQSGGHPVTQTRLWCHEHGEPTFHGGEEITWTFLLLSMLHFLELFLEFKFKTYIHFPDLPFSNQS